MIQTTIEKGSVTAKLILQEIMAHQRIMKNHIPHENYCQQCALPHLDKVINTIEKRKPVTFVLPAFPGKSPNLEKVLSPLPCLSEKLSLLFLNSLCVKIKKHYSPGAKIIICSDGRVFSDIIGMKESNVSHYKAEIKQIISSLSLSTLSLFDLDDYYHHSEFDAMRKALMDTYAQPIDEIKSKVKKGGDDHALPNEKEANQMYRGITRFLFEDSNTKNNLISRTQQQKEAKEKAYEVIRRSNAWSNLIEEKFTNAVRLSIHPQSCGAKKLGIRLVGQESWMTPWHGVAVKKNNRYYLMKKYQAEKLQATLIRNMDGRPSHYEIERG